MVQPKAPKVAAVLAGICAALQFGAGARGPGFFSGATGQWIGPRDQKQGETMGLPYQEPEKYRGLLEILPCSKCGKGVLPC